VDAWMEDVKVATDSKDGIANMVTFLVGTKTDVDPHHRQVPYEEGESKAAAFGCAGFYEVSAKSGDNMDQLLDDIASITWTRWSSVFEADASTNVKASKKPSRPTGKSSDFMDDTEWFLRDRSKKGRARGQDDTPPKVEFEGRACDPALAYGGFDETTKEPTEFKDPYANRLEEAREQAASAAEDRDYYMFKSANTNLNSDRNPKSADVRFMGPGWVHPPIKAASREQDFHYPARCKEEGVRYPMDAHNERDMSFLDDLDHYQGRSKNASHLRAGDGKPEKPVYVPIKFMADAASAAKAGESFVKLYSVHNLSATVLDLKNMIHKEYPDFLVPEMKIRVQTAGNSSSATQDDEDLTMMGNAADIKELEAAIADGQAVPEGAHNLGLAPAGQSSLYPCRGGKEVPSARLFMKTFTVEHEAAMVRRF